MIFQHPCQINAQLSSGPTYCNTAQEGMELGKTTFKSDSSTRSAVVRDKGMPAKSFSLGCWNDTSLILHYTQLYLCYLPLLKILISWSSFVSSPFPSLGCNFWQMSHSIWSLSLANRRQWLRYWDRQLRYWPQHGQTANVKKAWETSLP